MRASETAVVDLMEVRAAVRRKRPRRSALRHGAEFALFRVAVGFLRMLPEGSPTSAGRLAARALAASRCSIPVTGARAWNPSCGRSVAMRKSTNVAPNVSTQPRAIAAISADVFSG